MYGMKTLKADNWTNSSSKENDLTKYNVILCLRQRNINNYFTKGYFTSIWLDSSSVLRTKIC